ncbi:uncharacterized protein [Procambarus clarkii]|uniref:uncharacterized protein n=1 Tax=Procambarus clarkii TaxID=6728 RepID=UPI0037422B35
MGITIMQLNVRHFFNNKYLLELEACKYHPEVILLNETSARLDQHIKLYGYTTIERNSGQNRGVAVLIKLGCSFTNIYLQEENALAVEIVTNHGPLAILTTYIPPGEHSIHSRAIHKVLNRNVPTILAGNFNAHHAAFFNDTNGRDDIKGRLLYNLMTARHLTFLGPYFKTFVGNHEGKPDIILTNAECNIFHSRILPGNDVGSDHIPVILHLQASPFRILGRPRPNLNTLRLRPYMEFLGSDPTADLDNQPVQDIDTAIASIHTRITEATMANCDLTNTRIIQQYKPTREIKDKMRHYQQECVRRLRTGQPSLQIIQALRREVLGLTLLHKRHIWGTLVNQANQYKREPARCWGKIRKLLGSTKTPLSHLNYTYTDRQQTTPRE